MAGIDPREIKLMSAVEIAQQFGVRPATVYQWSINGCPCSNHQGETRFLLKDVIKWKRENQ